MIDIDQEFNKMVKTVLDQVERSVDTFIFRSLRDKLLKAMNNFYRAVFDNTKPKSKGGRFQVTSLDISMTSGIGYNDSYYECTLRFQADSKTISAVTEWFNSQTCGYTTEDFTSNPTTSGNCAPPKKVYIPETTSGTLSKRKDTNY